ncbi:HPr family phosphocarrier protein [Acetivibrio ethanolgignens]|uniref:PTS galactitol transporter subunit IIC n=1 Tax=Acetivibrio ethanolgignens TaxID=290052 RepID=A0A0V8QEF2_9FIRM|nr:HPr family phosphocarrier protein [Acetivibrio ethanolgignens]KSV58959.1 PTS galactitol transporter subunit IIC [Acetivibrio ethanolgignens]
MVKFDYVIKDELGLHARPAGLLVKEVKNYKSKITMEKDGKAADASRLIAIMGLGAKCGNTLKITVEGEDEAAAADAFKNFLSANL